MQERWKSSSFYSKVAQSHKASNVYNVYPKYLDVQANANSADPDQMLHSAASDQDLHCLPLIQQFTGTLTRLVECLLCV